MLSRVQKDPFSRRCGTKNRARCVQGWLAGMGGQLRAGGARAARRRRGARPRGGAGGATAPLADDRGHCGGGGSRSPARTLQVPPGRGRSRRGRGETRGPTAGSGAGERRLGPVIHGPRSSRGSEERCTLTSRRARSGVESTVGAGCHAPAQPLSHACGAVGAQSQPRVRGGRAAPPPYKRHHPPLPRPAKVSAPARPDTHREHEWGGERRDPPTPELSFCGGTWRWNEG